MSNQATQTDQALASTDTERTYNGISFNAAVAQWIEYWPPKPRVVGSIPASRTIRSPAKARSGAMAPRSIQAFLDVALLHLQG
jgi:hypothetical protein